MFAVRSGRFAVELRWVREVITLGHVTPVPGAPHHIGGAVNVRGTITPVIDIGVLSLSSQHAGSKAGRHALTDASGDRKDPLGDGAVLLDVDGVAVALRIVKVDEVATVGEGQEQPVQDCAGAVSVAVLDSQARPVPLVDPPELVRISLAAAHALAAELGASERTGGRDDLFG